MAENQTPKSILITEEVVKSPKDFFLHQNTRRFMTEEEIEREKKDLITWGEKNGHEITFFEKDEIIFYTTYLKKEDLRLIHQLTSFHGINNGELWKAGYINENKDIVLLAGGYYIAQGRRQAIQVFKKYKNLFPNMFMLKN